MNLPQTGGVKGKVTDGKDPLPAVSVSLLNFPSGTISDNDGNYLIDGIPVGKQKLKFSTIGYDSRIMEVEIVSNKIVILNITLEENPIEISEVKIIGSKARTHSDTRTSVIELDPKSAKVLPGAAEDVMRTLQSLPGVLAPNDFSSQLIVRGSGPDQNLIIIDDIEIFNPYRLYGAVSMFNPDAVSDVNLLSGGFPAKYGDRLSAVLDVTNKEGSKTSYLSGSLNASIISANLILEGKNPFDLKGSWTINSRRTYYDLIIEPFIKKAGLVDENVSLPNFYDVQSKFVFGPFEGHKFILNAIYSQDGVDVVSGKQRKTADSISINNLTKNNVLGFGWHYSAKRRFFNKLTISYYQNSGATNFNSEVLDPSLNRKDFENVVSDTLSPYLLGFKFDNDFTFKKTSFDDKITYQIQSHTIEAGAGIDLLETVINFYFKVDPQLRSFFSSNPGFRAVFNDVKEIKRYKRIRSYIEDNISLSSTLVVHPGLRYDYYEILGKYYLSPRISASYAFNNLTTLRAVFGVYYQSPGYEKIRDQNILFDLSETYTSNLQAERAYHYILGLDHWISSEWEFTIEAYQKKFLNLIVQKLEPGSAYATTLNPGADPHLVSSWSQPTLKSVDSLTQIPINNSYGTAYGIEILLAKKNIENDSRLTGWISYAFAFANRHEKNDIIPFAFDQRHTLNVVLNYKIDDTWNLGLRWQFGSGFPYTEPVGSKPRIILADLNGDLVPETPTIATRKSASDPTNEQVIFDIDYGNKARFNARKPVYHRLDLRITAAVTLWTFDWNFYLDVINIYNRKNINNFNYYVNEDLTLGREANAMFPIIPTLGFSIKF